MNSILSHHDTIQWDEPLFKITKFNNYINGINRKGRLVQVDIKHYASYELPSKKDGEVCGYQFLNNSFGKGYFFITPKQIYFEDQRIFMESNKKSDFEGIIDSNYENICLIKYHNIHKKYSINYMKLGHEKQILKLKQETVANLHLSRNDRILYTTEGNVFSLEGNSFENEILLSKNAYFLFDKNFVYLCPKGNKVRIYSKNDLSKVSKLSSLEFQLAKEEQVRKIENFRNNLLILQGQKLLIYDIRKLVEPFVKQNYEGIQDFYYEPNLQKIYISTNKSLRIHDYK